MRRRYLVALLCLPSCAALDNTDQTAARIDATCQVALPLAALAGTNIQTPIGWLGLAISSFCTHPHFDAAALKWLNDCVLGIERLLHRP